MAKYVLILLLGLSAASWGATIPPVVPNTLWELDDPGDAVWLPPGAIGDFRPTGDTEFEFVLITDQIIDWAVALLQAAEDPGSLIGLQAWEDVWSQELEFERYAPEHFPPPPAPIPLPAAGWLFLSALLGLFVMRRPRYG